MTYITDQEACLEKWTLWTNQCLSKANEIFYRNSSPTSNTSIETEIRITSSMTFQGWMSNNVKPLQNSKDQMCEYWEIKSQGKHFQAGAECIGWKPNHFKIIFWSFV